MARLAVARLWFCSNSFTPRRTRGEDLHFHAEDHRAGQIADPATSDTEMAGLNEFVARHSDWDVTLLRCASAPTGGPLSAEVFGNWMADVEEGLRRGRFDAVYLSLHGACQAEGDPAADLTIMRRVRSIIGHTPLVASFDVHANLSEEVAILLDGATCNDIWPSDGGAQAAIRALDLLDGIVSGRFRPVGALARVPFVLPEVLMGDTIRDIQHGTLKSLNAPVLEASVFSGFAWGDSPYTGPSALVWADRDAGAAREMAAKLAVELSRARSRCMPTLVAPESIMAAVGSHPRPTLLLDLGDDPMLGGLADTTSLFTAMLSGCVKFRSLIAAFFDPAAVATAFETGQGSTLDITIGGRFTRLYGAGVPVQATVVALGDPGDSARHAVLRVGMLDILVTAIRPVCITPAWLMARGIDIAAYAVIAVKGGSVARLAFDATVSETILCDAPGPTSQDLLRLRFHYVPAIRRAMGNDQRLTPDADLIVGRGLRSSGSRPRSEQAGADQAYHRYEDRRSNTKQTRPEPFRA
jgi:microcystin degradation protein MlrC